LTTALGFLTLGFADILPFIEFGVFTALGVIFAWFLAVFLLPVLLVFIPVHTSPSYEFGRKWPFFLYQWVINHKRSIIGISLLITAISGIGVSQLKVDSLLYEELSAGDRYSSSLHFFDKHFSGIRPVEIYIETLDDSTVFTSETLARIDSLDDYLTEFYGVRGIYSINTQIKRINRAMHRGLPHHFRLPSNAATLEKILHLVKNQYHSLALNTILTPDYKATVIAAKISDLGSYEIGKRNRALSEFLEQTFPPDQYLFRITGRALLLDKSNEVIAYNLGWGLLIALGAVSVMMGFLFKSLKMALMALIPNLLPLLIVAGVMGLFGVGLKMSTAVIFTIAFGIA
ncbi:MAG: MMPL family transporter, partial [Bacteroidetes bacterium]|nr:MMPL family transporter [Bacteroidota bacterium]